MPNKNIPELIVYSKDNNESLFSNNKFIIPIYQRNYSWGQKEIERLIDDLLMNREKYFLGSLIVRKKEENVYEVIDGQQRLTAFYLLFKYLGNITIPDDALIFQAREKSNKTMREIGSTFFINDNMNNVDYSEELIEGYIHIENLIKQKDTGTNNEKLTNRLNTAIFFLIEVPEKTDLNHYFEIMNTRGEQLEQHDIVKASLMFHLKSVRDKDLFANIWDSCSDMNRYIQMSFTMGNTNLRNNIFGDMWDKFEITDFDNLSKVYYSENENHQTSNINNNYDIWEILKDPPKANDDKTKDDDEDYRFDSIISFPHFLLHALTTFKKSDSDEEEESLNEMKLIENFEKCFSNKNDDDIKKFIMHLFSCKFYFDNYIIKREKQRTDSDSEDGEWSLLKLKKNDKKPSYNDSYDKNDANLMIQSCMRITFTSPQSMHWITRLLDERNIYDTIEMLEIYSRNKLPQKNEFEELSGFEFPRICFTYLDYLLWKKNNNKDFKFQYRTSIEHFYPQNPIVEQGHETLDDNSLNSFGNLALISIKGNSKFSNLDPKSKADSYPKVIDQSLKLMKMKEMINDYKDKNDLCKRINEHYLEMRQILYP